MGKATAPAAEMKRKKKKGRPSLADLQKRAQKPLTPLPNPSNSNITPTRRSTRRNPNPDPSSSPTPAPPSPEFIDDDDDDERKEKKVKLVVRLPQSNQQHFPHSGSANSGSDSDAEGDNHEVSLKKRKINAVDHRSGDVFTDQELKVPVATDNPQGLLLDSGPTTPLPDKTLLVFILDRLQKKDTYGVFSEPVDPNELPDYHEIIEHPMDFGTVRKKLDGGLYKSLEELEGDVFLICSNAMQYNAPDTIYFRQARSIQELARRDFENLRHEGEDGEPQPKVVRRGRPPSKNLKKSNEKPSIDRVGPDLASVATLAHVEEKATGSNSYNLRKAPSLYRYQSTDGFVAPNRSRTGEDNPEWSIDWNNEFPASILRADMKYGKKNFTTLDENKRDTYKTFQGSSLANEPSLLSHLDNDPKRLLAVGLHFEQHAYARSLARFAANLGPVAWRVASKKIESVLPAGVKFGPGWVGENEAPPQSPLSSDTQKVSSATTTEQLKNATSVNSALGMNSALKINPSEEMAQSIRRLNSPNGLAVQGGAFLWKTPSSSQAQLKTMNHSVRNGINGTLGFSPSQRSTRLGAPTGQCGQDQASVPCEMLSMVARSDTAGSHPGLANNMKVEECKPSESGSSFHSGNSVVQARSPDFHPAHELMLSGKTWQVLPAQYRQSLPVPPDLNVGVQPPGSPGSTLQIGSSQQPDLALQL